MPSPSPRQQFAALLDSFDQWLRAEKEKGSDTLHASPELVRSLKNPIPAPAAPGKPAAAPAAVLVVFMAPPAGGAEGEELLSRMIAAMGLAKSEMVVLRTGSATPPLDSLAPIRPAAVVCFDEAAWVAMGGKDFARVRGAWQKIAGLAVMPTFGPEHLVKNPADKKAAWKDLQAVLAKVGRSAPPVRK